MKVNIDKSNSFMGELGVSAGKVFHNEFMDNNEVVLNDRYRFNLDLSGRTGKYGIGVDIK